MNKINNKIIILSLEVLVILAFGVIAFMPIETKAERPLYVPYYYFDSDSINNPASIATYTALIPGCEGRNTGFSTVTGQSCARNYIGNSTTVVRNYNTYNTNTTTSTTKTTDSVATATSDINENYGSLAANALFGSNSFMPSGLIQWIFFVLLILAIIFLWRYVHRSEEKYMIEPMKHA